MNTSDWKTCLNEKYGYEFKYPPDLYVYTRDNPIAYDEWRTTRSVNGITDCNGTQVAFSSLENDSRLNQYAGFQFSLKLLTEQKTIEEVLDGYEEQLDRQDSTGERLFLCPIAEKIGVGKVDTVTVYDIEWMCSSTSKPNTISPNSHNLLMVNKNTTWEMSIYGPFGKEVQSSGVNFFETILSTFRFVDIERKG
jgi:hypothetical protein